MEKQVTVTECGYEDSFTRAEVADMLGIRPARIMRYWIKEVNHGGSHIGYFLFANIREGS